MLQLPSPELNSQFLPCLEDQQTRHHVFADASHAPYRCLGRKGVSGGVMCYAGCLVHAVAKVQGVESRFRRARPNCMPYNICDMCQESIGLIWLIERVLSSLEGFPVEITSQAHVFEQSEDGGEDPENSRIVTDLLTDSQSAIDLLKGQDLPRRSRHI